VIRRDDRANSPRIARTTPCPAGKVRASPVARPRRRTKHGLPSGADRPLSPAWGLSAQRAMRVCSIPNHHEARPASPEARRRIEFGVTASTTSRNVNAVVAATTRSWSDASIHRRVGLVESRRASRRPGYSKPVPASKAALSIGAVTLPFHGRPFCGRHLHRPAQWPCRRAAPAAAGVSPFLASIIRRRSRRRHKRALKRAHDRRTTRQQPAEFPGRRARAGDFRTMPRDPM